MVVVNRIKKKSVGDFVGQYNKASTRKSYKSSLRGFFKHVYPELDELFPYGVPRRKRKEFFKIFDPKMDELSLVYIMGEGDIEADVVSYRKKLTEDGLAPKTIGGSFAAIFKYLECNDLTFTKDWKKKLIGKVSQRGISKETVPNPFELKRIIYNLPPHGRALTYILGMGGMRPDEAIQLRLSDLDLDYVAHFLDKNRRMKSVPISKINIRAETSKTGEARHTYVTREAKIEIERWLAMRSAFIKKQNAAGFYPDEDKVFPFSLGNFRLLWITALKKCDLHELDQQTNRVTLRPHNLRKFFRTFGGWSNPDVPECLEGHQRGMSKIYARPDQAERILVEEYKKAEANLTLNEQILFQSSGEDVKVVEAKLERAERDIEDLREIITGLNTLVSEMQQQMDEFRDSYQTE